MVDDWVDRTVGQTVVRKEVGLADSMVVLSAVSSAAHWVESSADRSAWKSAVWMAEQMVVWWES